MRDFWRKLAGQLERPKAASAQALFEQLASLDSHAVFDQPKPFVTRQTTAQPLPGWDYLPLEAFRDSFTSTFQGEEVARSFRSSGTTSQDRSTSLFSRDGLCLYKAQSLLAYFRLIEMLFDRDPTTVTGFCLVPPVSEWPDSSLAQMAAWIGEYAPMQYATEETLKAQVTSQGPAQEQAPVWIFGTAFHLLNLIDAGMAPALPPGSRVIETGGLKGKARQVTKSELYAEISRAFQVPLSAIASEYGMCELACQAYEWQKADGTRAFRFPAWVKTRVVTGPQTIEGEGSGALFSGALLVHDPLRIDYPWALRAEDFVTLNKNADFSVHGRIEKAPLKGCSLRVDEVLTRNKICSETSQKPAAAKPKLMEPLNQKTLNERAAKLMPLLQELCSSSAARRVLSPELGSDNAADAALDDLKASLPASALDWVKAAERSVDTTVTPQSWLIILPANHSLVGLYPLAMAYMLGLDLTVRLPARFAQGENFLQLYLAKLKSLTTIDVVGPEFKLGDQNSKSHFQAVLCYGSDETVAAIKKETTLPVVGFGNRFSISMLKASELPMAGSLLVKDALGLAQQGCMSSRLAVIITDEALKTKSAILNAVTEAATNFWSTTLPTQAKLGHELEFWRYQNLAPQLAAKGIKLTLSKPAANAPLIPVAEISSAKDFNLDLLTQLISKHAFVLPLVLMSENILLENVKSTAQAASAISDEAIGTVTVSPDLERSPILVKYRYQWPQIRALGEANAPHWDGTHEGRGLFNLNG